MLLSAILWGTAALVGTIASFILYIYKSHSDYFTKHGIPYMGVGLKAMIQFLTNSTNLAKVEVKTYKLAASYGPIVGMSDFGTQKGIYVTDLELIRNIYVKDFDHFVNRRPVLTTSSNLLFKKMLFTLEGEQWKGIRTKLSPTFTTGKIRKMFEIFAKSSERLASYVKKEVGPQGGEFDFHLVFPKYAMDVIASCAFGIDSKCFEVPPDQCSVFEDMGKKFQFQLTASAFIKFIAMLVAPKVVDYFKWEVFADVPQNYFATVIKDVIKRRRQTGERYDDFLQLMLDAQQGLLKMDEDTQEVLNGTTEVTTGLLSDTDKSKVTFDDDDVIANCLLFILGGFDTTQSLLLFAVYELALEQDVQKKVYAEVKAALDARNGKLTYDAVQEMSYLEMFLNETLRFFPPAVRTERTCTKDYPVPGTDIVIEKGITVGMPIYTIHRDPKYFENPDVFDPDRFLPEQKSARHPYAFMAFGHGPRNCIGMRFALTEVKAVIAMLVYTFKFERGANTKVPIEFGQSTNLKPKDGMFLKITPRN